MNKNDTVKLEITAVANDGAGVGRYEGMAVFVPFTAVGDIIECKIVKVKNTYAYGIISQIIRQSPHRVSPDCDVFGKCGGCVFRHFSYGEELNVKQLIVENAFKRIGGLSPEFERIIPSEKTERYRNKAQYPVTEKDGRPVCGFYAQRSHRVVPASDCILQPEVFGKIVRLVLDYIEQKKLSVFSEETGKGLIRHIYLRRGEHTGEIMVCIVASKDISSQLSELCGKLAESFSNIKSIILNINPFPTNVILGEKNVLLYGSETITDIMCGNIVKISPLSFYQVNTPQAERLYRKAFEYASLKSGDVVADLYCGAGTIGLYFAKAAGNIKLVGIEAVAQAVENARLNALENGISNAEFYCGDAGKVFAELREKGCRPDVIVVDPPRKGCDDVTVNETVKAAPERIVMISCNPATAARDAKRFAELGYQTVKVCPVDLFPRTSHVECVVGMACRRS